MGMDRFIVWDKDFTDREPTLEALAEVARDFLGDRWKVSITDPTWLVCECDDPQTFSLASQCTDDSYFRAMKENFAGRKRGFEVYFPGKDSKSATSVITRQDDEFTCALADRYAKIIARWWHGKIEWPG